MLAETTADAGSARAPAGAVSTLSSFSPSLATGRWCMVARPHIPAAQIRPRQPPASRGRLLDASEDPSSRRRRTHDRGSGPGGHDHPRTHHREPGRAHHYHDDRLVDGHHRRQHGGVRAHAGPRLQPDGGAGGQLRDRLGRDVSHRRPERPPCRHALLLPAEGQRRHRAGHGRVGTLLHDPQEPDRSDRPVLHGHRRLGPGQRP